jgi:hypothetical protein
MADRAEEGARMTRDPADNPCEAKTAKKGEMRRCKAIAEIPLLQETKWICASGHEMLEGFVAQR